MSTARIVQVGFPDQPVSLSSLNVSSDAAEAENVGEYWCSRTKTAQAENAFPMGGFYVQSKLLSRVNQLACLPTQGRRI